MSLTSLAGQKVGVWGLGREGREAVRVLTPIGTPIAVVDHHNPDKVRAEAAELGIETVDIDDLVDDGIATVVRSPGISPYRDDAVALTAAGVTHRGLTAMWLDDQDPNRIIAVTGTKGKSTTSALTAAVLTAAGVPARHLGNVGVPPTSLTDDVLVVLEVSSYQAHDMEHSPSLGVLTSLNEDHVDWHHGVANYQRDKLRLFAGPELQHLVVGEACVPIVNDLQRLAPQATIEVARRGHIDVFPTAADTERNPQLAIPHFRDDLAMAVAAASHRAHITDEVIATALATDPWLPHRFNPIGTVAGVRYIDDALATNPVPVLCAIDAAVGLTDGTVWMIMGGHDRGVDNTTVFDRLATTTNLSIIATSDTGRTLDTELSSRGFDRLEYVEGFEDAVRTAGERATAGDVVVLCPAAATPARDGDYRDRAATFARVVDELGRTGAPP